jgi:hypothetical protein
VVEPIKTVTKEYNADSAKYEFKIDNLLLFMDTEYQFQIVVSGSDNQNVIEIASPKTEFYMLTGLLPPVVNLTLAQNGNSVTATTTVTDADATLSGNLTISIIETVDNQVLASQTFPADGKAHNFTYNGLQPLTKYKVQVSGTMCLSANAAECVMGNSNYYPNYIFVSRDVWGVTSMLLNFEKMRGK